MGLPMARNLLKKMGSDTHFFVFDVVQDSIDTLVKEGQGKVHGCGSSKEVADKSVRFMSSDTSVSLLLTYMCRT